MVYKYKLVSVEGRTLYIGRTENLAQRLEGHRQDGKLLLPRKFTMVVIGEAPTRKEASKLERWWIVVYRACGASLLNKSWDGGRHVAMWNARRVLTPEYRQKISETLKRKYAAGEIVETPAQKAQRAAMVALCPKHSKKP
jgi:predicted GIY-YIG superfamily endonuclease